MLINYLFFSILLNIFTTEPVATKSKNLELFEACEISEVIDFQTFNESIKGFEKFDT